MARALVVEDDPVVQSALVQTLQELGHVVRAVSTAMEALREVTSSAFDFVVFDLGLPDIDGVVALRMLRTVTTVPVIVATARAAEEWLIRSFDAGADDFLVKPFSRQHLAARVGALLRRSGGSSTAAEGSELVVGELRINPRARTAELGGTPMPLSRREFDLLAHLVAKQGQVVTRRELFLEVWGQPNAGDKTLDVHVSWLRRKLGETAAAPRYLRTVRGVGMMLVTPEP